MRRLLPLALSAVLALSVAACGDDSSGGSTADGSDRPATATAGDAFCVAAEKMNASTTAFGVAALAQEDAAALEAAMQTIQADGAAVLAAAPTDIEAEVRISIEAFDEVAAGLEKAGWDFAAATKDAEFAALMANADLETNGNTIDAYLLSNCNLGS
jgi:hypothetical protein